MLRTRLIACLLVRDGGLVKTTAFREAKYVGDPLNAVRIFNEKEVDELMVLDIDATALRKGLDYNLIGKLAGECTMPLCYGGGVQEIDQIERIIALGVEKVAISSAAIMRPKLVHEASVRVGSQSVVVVLDVKRGRWRKKWELFIHNGTKPVRRDPFECAQEAEENGAGEIVINSIDRDGMGSGYDTDLLKRMRQTVKIPVTILGGAGSYEDIYALDQEFGPLGAAAGSLFVFKGKYKAVLLQYPSEEDKMRLLAGRVISQD